MRFLALPLLFYVLLLLPAPAHAQAGAAAADSAQVVRAVTAFRAALAEGDSAAVARMLLPEAIVLESGGTETRLEYLAHHFHADHAFLSVMTREVQHRRVRMEDDVAWVASSSQLSGSYEGQELALASAELIVLRRRPGGWRVAAVHWSSRTRE